MKHTLDDFASTVATGWYRTLERQLRAMYQLETRTRQAMLELEAEWRALGIRSSQTFHVKIRKNQTLPDSIHRVRICGTRGLPGDFVDPDGKPYHRWVIHLKGKPTRAQMYRDVGNVDLLDLFRSFYNRATCLNRARHTLVLGRLSIERRLKAHAEPEPREAGELSTPAPLLLSRDLPDTSSRALGAAWRLFLRVAALQFELVLIAARYNATTPYKGLRLTFHTDSDHPYGRFTWTLHGKTLIGFAGSFARDRARSRAKGTLTRRIDPANLPDRLLRKLRIPAAARMAIAPHELQRRRITRLYQRHLDVLVALFSTSPECLSRAQPLLGSAGFSEEP